MTQKPRFVAEMPDHPFCIAMREERAKRNWSLHYMAEKGIGCSRSYLGDVEKGRYAPSVEFGFFICQLLKIPVHICMDYICQHEMLKQQTILRQQYSEWYENVPEEVANDLLFSDEGQKLHSIFYKSPNTHEVCV